MKEKIKKEDMVCPACKEIAVPVVGCYCPKCQKLKFLMVWKGKVKP